MRTQGTWPVVFPRLRFLHQVSVRADRSEQSGELVSARVKQCDGSRRWHLHREERDCDQVIGGEPVDVSVA